MSAENPDYNPDKAFNTGLDPYADEIELTNLYRPGIKLQFQTEEWVAFLKGAIDGEFDLLINDENEPPS